MKQVSIVLILSAFITPVQAATVIDYDLGPGWTYETEGPPTTIIAEVPGGGVRIDINIPSATEGGLGASRHSLPGLSFATDGFLELHYSDFSSNSVGADVNMVLEVEFLDTNNAFYELAIALIENDGDVSFLSWLQTEEAQCPACGESATDSPVNVNAIDGILGIEWFSGSARVYFIDSQGEKTYPLAPWDISGIIGAGSFAVDNDFEAITGIGESVVASVIFERVIFTASATTSGTVEHTFSTTDPIFIDPLLTGLTSVSGSFTFENGVLPDPDPIAVGRNAGSTVYRAVSNLSGNANGSSFSDPLGGVGVGDEKRLGEPDSPVDVVQVNWEPGRLDPDLSGFTFAGLPLVNVRFHWVEGQDGIGDFLEDDALPAILPPTISGRLFMDFDDGAGGRALAIFSVTVVPIIPADSDITFSGPLSVVQVDDGSGVYSGVPIGTNFFGSINRFTSDGFISDGTTLTSFSFGVTHPHPGVEVSNDVVLDAEDAALGTALGGPGFSAGDIVDLIVIEGDSVAGGGLLFVGLVYVLDPLAFDNESRNNFPPDPDDILLKYFFVDEEGGPGPDIYSAAGVIDSDGDGMPDHFELANSFDPNNPADANEDADSDGLTNLQEFIAGTLPRNPDSDGDTVLDGLDAFPNDPTESVDTDSDGIGNNADLDDDGDGMPDDFELANGLDPLNAADAATDADGDGFTNLEEFRRRTDPRNPADFPIVPVAINTLLLGEDEE